MRSSRLTILAALLFVPALLLPAAAFAEAGRVIKIGVLTDLSGKAAYAGQQTRVAMELLKKDLTGGGKQVEFVLADHGLDTAKAVTETQKLLAIDKVDAVFSNFSGTSRAASPVVKNAKKLFVYTAAAVEPVTTNPQAFKSYLDYVVGCQKIANYWKSQGVKVLGLLKAEAEFGELCLEGAKREYPDPVVITYKPGEDVASQVLSLKSKKVEGILNAGYEGDMGNMLKSMRQLNFTSRVGANEDIFTPKVIADYKDLLATATSFGMPKLDPQFVARVKEMDTKNLTGSLDLAGMAYLHLKQTYEAVASCPADDVPCEMDKLQKSPKDASFGFLGWREDRQADYAWTLSQFKGEQFIAMP